MKIERFQSDERRHPMSPARICCGLQAILNCDFGHFCQSHRTEHVDYGHTRDAELSESPKSVAQAGKREKQFSVMLGTMRSLLFKMLISLTPHVVYGHKKERHEERWSLKKVKQYQVGSKRQRPKYDWLMTQLIISSKPVTLSDTTLATTSRSGEDSPFHGRTKMSSGQSQRRPRNIVWSDCS